MYGETTPNSAAALMYGEIIPKLIIIIIGNSYSINLVLVIS